MVEVHYVFEDETAASLQFVPKNQSGLQGLTIIDPLELTGDLLPTDSQMGVNA